MSNDGMIQGWPEELTLLLEDMFTVKQMPSVYYEYLLAKAAMADLGYSSIKTDPTVFIHIKEMYIDDEGNYGIFPFERND